MPGPEVVVRALAATQELRHAIGLADRFKALAAAREHLVRIALVPHVEDESIGRRIEYVVNRSEQLDGTEARREVATRLRDVLEDLLAEFARNLLEILARDFAQVGGAVDAVQNSLGHVLPFLRQPPVFTERPGFNFMLRVAAR